MFESYLKTAFRNIWNHKGFSLINIAGLAIAMTVSIIILLWCNYELSYNKYLENYDRIYRVNTEYHLSSEIERYRSSPEPTGRTLTEMFPEVINHCHFYNATGLMVIDEKKFMERNMVFTDPGFLEMFSVNTIQGDRNTMLDDPYAIILTKSMANKYFENENPIGKTIRRNDDIDFTISGVIEDFPANATYSYDFIMSVNIFKEWEVGFLGRWSNISGETYIMTEPNTNINLLGEKIYNVPNELSDEEVCFLWLQPLSKIHLYKLNGGGAIQYIYIFLAVGLIVLIIACINFMNLSTARSSVRAKEVGMRKVSGAHRAHLIRQFFGESILLAILAMMLALVFTEIVISSADRFAHINDAMNELLNYKSVLMILGLTVLTGIFAGSYPAFILSKFNPISVLKGVYTKGKQGDAFRKLLVVIQFSLSIILIVSTLVVFNQMQYMKQKDLGFNKDNMLYLPMRGEIAEKFYEFKEELLKIPDIQNVTRSSSKLTEIGYIASGLNWEGRAEEDDPIFSFEGVDYDYFETCEMEFVAGRGFSRDFADDEKNYVLNEKAIKRIGYEGDVLGRMFDMWGREGKIIGVVKDFNFQHQSREIDPLILTYFPEYYNHVLIKIESSDLGAVISQIENTWQSFVSQFPFEYNFMDDDFEKLYKNEQNMGSLFQVFTALAVFISCLGLFGLATFVVERRTKEIGVRKVLGATSGGLIMLLIRDFTKWVLLANVIAWPVAWFTMNKWLQNYAYKTELTTLPFIAAGLAALIIAIITVLLQTYKAANANPVEALKYE